MFRSVRLALLAAAAFAATTALAEAQTGPGNNTNGPPGPDGYGRPFVQNNQNQNGPNDQNGPNNQNGPGSRNDRHSGDNYGPRSGGQGYGYGPRFGGPRYNDGPRSGEQGYGYGPRSGGPHYHYGPRAGGQGYGYGPRNGGPGFNGPNFNGPRFGGPGHNYGPRDGGPGYGYGPRDGGPGYGYGPRNFGPDFNGPRFGGPGYNYGPRNFGPRNGGPRNGGPGFIPRNGAPGAPGQAAAAGGYLGVEIQGINQSLADALKLANTNGALISSVSMGSPAATAGLKPGDVVTAVDGKAVNNARDLTALIRADQPSMTVDLTLMRAGAKQDVMVTLGSVPGAQRQAGPGPNGPNGGPGNGPNNGPGNGRNGGPGNGPNAGPNAGPGNGPGGPASGGNANPPPAAPPGSLGLTIGPAPGQNGGVVINGVAPNSPAANAGLRGGEQILAVGTTPVATPGDVAVAVNAARTAGMKDVLLQVQSPRGVTFVAIPLS